NNIVEYDAVAYTEFNIQAAVCLLCNGDMCNHYAIALLKTGECIGKCTCLPVSGISNAIASPLAHGHKLLGEWEGIYLQISSDYAITAQMIAQFVDICSSLTVSGVSNTIKFI